MTTTIQLTATE